jgi:hypothetical protein
LEEVVGSELHFFVSPLGSAIAAGDEPHPVETAEVAVDEGISAFGLIGRPDREPEVPLRIVLPGVTIEEGVLVVRCRLCVAPFAAKDVVAGRDQLLCLADPGSVDFVLDDGLLNGRS